MGISRRDALEMADLRTGVSSRSRVDVVVSDIKILLVEQSVGNQWVNQLRGELTGPGPVGPDPVG
jgi:hypothetical protein